MAIYFDREVAKKKKKKIIIIKSLLSLSYTVPALSTTYTSVPVIVLTDKIAPKSGLLPAAVLEAAEA